MMNFNFCKARLFLTGVLSFAGCFSSEVYSQENLYATGGFNDWNVKSPLTFNKNGDLFTATIDFSISKEFKMSTVSGKDSSGNGWDLFDTGALRPVGDTSLNTWLPLVAEYHGNINAPESSELEIEVDLKEMKMRFLKVERKAYSETLPVIFINTENNQPIISKEDYIQAGYWLDPCGLEGVEALGSKQNPLPLQIRGRGNWTWTGFDKKPYRIKLGEKASLAGLDKSKHFVLLAHADDNIGFMRNTLGFAASEQIGLTWTPKQKPVEVVLNGDYIGLYFVTENIRVDKNRVNVTEQKDLATENVDGGWLVEIDNYNSDPHVTVYEGDYPIWFTYKSPEELSAQQQSYLQTSMQAIQDAVASKDFAKFTSLVDVESLAKYYIVQEVMNDYESFHGSCYLFRQRGENEKWRFGPVWDFGSALFNDENRWIYESNYHQVWIGAICNGMPQFLDVVKKEWNSFLSNSGPSKIEKCGRQLAEDIKVAARLNYKRWPQYGNSDELESAETAFNRFDSKIEWLRHRWSEPVEASIINTNDSPILSISVENGELKIVVAQQTNANLVSLTGRTQRLQLFEGVNIISVPKGFYVLEGHKIII